MATANQLPPQPGVQPPAQAAVNTANNIVEQHPWMATQAPEITSDLISGNADPATVDRSGDASRAGLVSAAE